MRPCISSKICPSSRNTLSPLYVSSGCTIFRRMAGSHRGGPSFVRLAPSSLFASIYVLTYLRSRSALSRVSLPFLSRSLISLISIYVDPARLLCESPIPECFPDEYSSGFPLFFEQTSTCAKLGVVSELPVRLKSVSPLGTAFSIPAGHLAIEKYLHPLPSTRIQSPQIFGD